MPIETQPAGEQRNRAVSGEFFIQNEGGWGLSDARPTEARRSLIQNEGFGRPVGWVKGTETDGGWRVVMVWEPAGGLIDHFMVGRQIESSTA